VKHGFLKAHWGSEDVAILNMPIGFLTTCMSSRPCELALKKKDQQKTRKRANGLFQAISPCAGNEKH